jgi:hypothetical protein
VHKDRFLWNSIGFSTEIRLANPAYEQIMASTQLTLFMQLGHAIRRQVGIATGFTALIPVHGSNGVGYGSASKAFTSHGRTQRRAGDDGRTGFGSAIEAQHPLHHGR